MIRLDDIAIGDRWPFPYFRLMEKVLQGGRFVKREIDVATDFTEVRFSSRHEDNLEDQDDHTKDDIYGIMIVDSGGLIHYEWGAGETDLGGTYIGRLTGTRADSKIWHSKIWFTYNVVPKGRFGRTTS